LEPRLNQGFAAPETPITEDELTRLLERLGEQEFGGSESATLGAVAEATGADLADLGAILHGMRAEERAAERAWRFSDETEQRDIDVEPRRPVRYGRRAAAVGEDSPDEEPVEEFIEPVVGRREQEQIAKRLRESRNWMMITTVAFLFVMFVLLALLPIFIAAR
jgi:hypothetical protein